MIVPRRARRRSLAMVYHGVFYALAATPVWGAATVFVIVWHRTHL